MSKFYGMLSNDVREQHFAKLAQAKANVSAQDELIAAEIIDKIAAASNSTGDSFTKDQVLDIIRSRLELERGLGADQQFAHNQMMLEFREDLAEHGLPAHEILDFFQHLDLDTPEGLRFAVDDIIALGEIISEYAVRLEAEKAARASMPAPKKADILRTIFGLELN